MNPWLYSILEKKCTADQLPQDIIVEYFSAAATSSCILMGEVVSPANRQNL